MIHPTRPLFNPEISIPSGNMPDMAALRAVWHSLRAEEASSSFGCHLGIARRRSELLASVEPWRIPELIDALNRPEPEGVAL